MASNLFRPKYKSIPKSKMSLLISMYLKVFKRELLKGKAVGYPTCFFQIVETKNFNIRMDRQKFLEKKPTRSLGEYNLGPLSKKIFIKLYHKREKEFLIARALSPFNKEMYKSVMNNKKFQEYVD